MGTRQRTARSSAFAAAGFRERRRGAVLVTIVALIAIALALFGIWAQTAVREHRRQAYQVLRLQAARLAEAGVRRGTVQREADPEYTGETWTIPAESLGGTHAAEVRIRVTPTDDAARFEATAQFPAGAIRRAQVTTRLEISNPVSRVEP